MSETGASSSVTWRPVSSASVEASPGWVGSAITTAIWRSLHRNGITDSSRAFFSVTRGDGVGVRSLPAQIGDVEAELLGQRGDEDLLVDQARVDEEGPEALPRRHELEQSFVDLLRGEDALGFQDLAEHRAGACSLRPWCGDDRHAAIAEPSTAGSRRGRPGFRPR